MMTLKNRCMMLPYMERLNLCAVLQDSIRQERRERSQGIFRPSRCEVLLGYMEQIMGEPILIKSRESRFVWARTMVAYQMSQEGFTAVETGEMMGKDHATVVYMKNKMQNALDLSYAYDDIIDIWKQFQNKIKDEIYRGTTQDLISLGR